MGFSTLERLAGKKISAKVSIENYPSFLTMEKCVKHLQDNKIP
jgi:hypothetical protein